MKDPSGTDSKQPLRALERRAFVVADPDVRALVLADLRALSQQVEYLDRIDQAAEALARAAEPSVVGVGLSATTVESIEWIQAIRRRAPHASILLAARWSTTFTRAITAYAVAGCDAIIHLGEMDGGPALRSEVRTRFAQTLPARLVAKVAGPDSSGIASWVLRNSFRPLRLEDAANWYGCDASTVERRLKRDDGSTWEALRWKGRLLHCALALDSGGTQVAIARGRLGFRSAATFSTFVKRHTGMQPSRLRHLGALSVVEAIVQSR